MIVCILGAVLSVAQPAVPASSPPQPAPAASPKDSPLAPAVLQAAAEYKRFRRVSDVPYWSPVMCSTPSASGVRESASKDAETHGRKLYFLFARLHAEYLTFSASAERQRWNEKEREAAKSKPWINSIGQALVKESFEPVAVPEGAEPKRNPWKWADPAEPYLDPTYPVEYTQNAEGKFFRIGAPVGLFIMVKVDPKTPGTDDGWIYATTSPDGKTITSIGRVESCMNCHKETTRDRVYGTTWSWPYDLVAEKSVLPTKENEDRCRKQREEREARQKAERDRWNAQPAPPKPDQQPPKDEKRGG